jgi:transcriptional regulator with XRE-family HTH domain
MATRGKVYKLENHKETGELLKLARLEKGESGEQVAKHAGMAQPQVSKLENGGQLFYTEALKPRVEALAKHLGLDVRFTEVAWEDAYGTKKKPAPKRGRPRKVQSVSVTNDAERMVESTRLLLDMHQKGLISSEDFVKLASGLGR